MIRKGWKKRGPATGATQIVGGVSERVLPKRGEKGGKDQAKGSFLFSTWVSRRWTPRRRSLFFSSLVLMPLHLHMVERGPPMISSESRRRLSEVAEGIKILGTSEVKKLNCDLAMLQLMG